ncbi:C2H2 and C2HC zinc fingers superfamily protein [Actinidia rufa]|uniref:U1 small nuclear ribonucleoprotein C n=1 Tax=Actinidia rufa TaxID=165716 RepID=A0A7J0GSW2_9ERIC|nr:C2H2 and C2HC zinc fingers superfamily protein [Actinidia rufa]
MPYGDSTVNVENLDRDGISKSSYPHNGWQALEALIVVSIEIDNGQMRNSLPLGLFHGSFVSEQSIMPRYFCDYCDTYLTHDSPSVRKQHNAGYKHKANVRSYYQQFEAQQNQSLIDQKIKEHLGQAAYQQVGASYNQLRPRLPIRPTPLMPMPGNMQLPMNSPLLPGVRPPVLPRPLPGAYICSGLGHMSRSNQVHVNIGVRPFRMVLFGFHEMPSQKHITRPRVNILFKAAYVLTLPNLLKGEPYAPGEGMDRGVAVTTASQTLEKPPYSCYVPAPGLPPMMAPPGAFPFPGQVNGLPGPPTMTAPTGVPGTAVTPTASGATSMVTPVMYQPNSAAPTSGGFDSFNMSTQASEANH